MIENEDCTTDWLAVNAPDYYGFYPSQEVVSKVMRLMQTIKNPNDVIWHGFHVELENGNFKYARVKGKTEGVDKEKSGESEKGMEDDEIVGNEC